MVIITEQNSKGHKQHRVTIPAALILALGWKPGDILSTSFHKGGILLRKVSEKKTGEWRLR